MKPINAKVIVKLAEPPRMSGGLLYIPDNARGRVNRGTVVAVGPGREYPNGTRVTPGVVPGDFVAWTSYAEVPVQCRVGDDELVAVSQEEILCVIEGCCPYPEVRGTTCTNCGGAS